MPTVFYQKNKEKLQNKGCTRYQSLSEEKENNKLQYARERHQNIFEEEKEKPQYYHQHHKNLSEEEKQKIAEYRRNCYITHKR